MASRVLFKRKIGGTGSPGVPGAVEGEIALAFPAVGTTPELWAFAAGAWERVNPPAGAVTQQAVNLNNPGGADIGAAATAWIGANAAFTGDIVLGTYGNPAQAYILTNAAAPGNAASWTSLGGAVSFAAAGDITTGTDTVKALNSIALRGATLNAPTGTPANDADFFIRLGATGKIDSRFLPAVPTKVLGSHDPSTPPTVPAGGFQNGDMVFMNKTGTVNTGWTGPAAGTAVKSGDMLLYDGAAWHAIPNETDLNAYLQLAGGSMAADATITFDAGSATKTILDGKGGTVDNVVLDCGTY